MTTQVSAGDILRAIYAPSKWYIRAARALGLKVGTVFDIANGRRPMTARHWSIVRATADWAPERIRRYGKAEMARIGAETAKREKAALEAREEILRVIKSLPPRK